MDSPAFVSRTQRVTKGKQMGQQTLVTWMGFPRLKQNLTEKRQAGLEWDGSVSNVQTPEFKSQKSFKKKERKPQISAYDPTLGKQK